MFDHDEIVNWDRGDELIPCYFKGVWGPEAERTGDGLRGDVRLRPARLGPVPFTFTVAPDTVHPREGS